MTDRAVSGRWGPIGGRSHRGRVVTSLLAAVGMLGGLLVMDVQPSGATSSVHPVVTAPQTAGPNPAAYGVAARAQNQSSAPVYSAKISISVVGGTLTGLPSEADQCDQSSSTQATCTADAFLLPGDSTNPYTFQVTPAIGAAKVVSSVTASWKDAPLAGSESTSAPVKKETLIYGVQLGLTNDPTTVKPGTDTRLEATVKNLGSAQNITLTIDTGGTIDKALALQLGCTDTTSALLTCEKDFDAGESASFRVAVTTPSLPPGEKGTMTSFADAVGALGGDAEAGPVTTMTDPDAEDVFLPAGAQACDARTTESQCITAPNHWTEGSTFTLREFDLGNPPPDCEPGVPCDRFAAEQLWPEPDESLLDVTKPVLIHLTFPERQTCNAKSQPAGCYGLKWAKSPTPENPVIGAIQDLLACPSFTTSQRRPPVMANVGTPCLNYIDAQIQGLRTFEIAAGIDNLIPKISL